MSSFQAPMNVPPTSADVIDEMEAKIKVAQHRAARVMDIPVKGPRGQHLTVTIAQDRSQKLAEAIDTEEAHGSQRHRRVATIFNALVLLVVIVVDFPVMEWLSSSVFNVDWSDPLGFPLAISIVISLLATGGAAGVLHHLGHDQRQNKDHRGHLDTTKLTAGSKFSLLGVGVLVVLISLVMYYRIYTEGELSGLGSLVILLAILVAVVILLTAWLVFWTAFRDGSPEQDDLMHYTGLVQQHLHLKRSYEDIVHDLKEQIELIRRRIDRMNTGAYIEVIHQSCRNGHDIPRQSLHLQDDIKDSTPDAEQGAFNTSEPPR
jgi:hypothetical protein